MPIPSTAIQRRWLHSHEEDTATEMVFRDSSYGFPPSRGRVGFELHADGSYIDLGIAPADGVMESEGTWKLEGDTLELDCDAHPGGRCEMRVLTLADGRLVVEK